MDIVDFVDRMLRAENTQDWAAMAALLADDAVITHPGVGPVTGRDDNLVVIQLVTGAIDGYHRTTDDTLVAGDRCAFRFTITGTHTGDLPGFPATGEPVEIAGSVFAELRGGRLVRAVEMLEHDSIRGLSLR